MNKRHSIQDDRGHTLIRPELTFGSTVLDKYSEYIFKDEEFRLTEVEYTPALVKMCNEIIDNSTDILQKKKSGKVEVLMTDKSLTVKDNGDGIPIDYIKDLDGSDILIPYACWGKSKSGSNFNEDEDDATTIGTNGVGSYATNVMSTKFIGTTCDGIKQFKGTWTDNANPELYKEEISTKKTKGTVVYFEPDFKRLDCENFSDDIKTVIRQRLINLSLTYTNIKFYFNKELIKIDTKSLTSNGTYYNEDKFSIIVSSNNTDDFESFSIINGLNIKSGSHIDYIIRYLVQGIKDKLPKKYNDIKPGDIKNKLKIIFIGKQFPRMKFESQTKETLKNSAKEVSDYLGEDWKALVKDIIKNKELLKSITEYFDIKKEFEARKALKELNKPVKKIRNEKFMHPIGDWENIFLAEGDSASASISKILGREKKGYFAMFGVPPNAYDIKLKDIAGTKKLVELKSILNIDYTKEVQNNITFKNIIIATDFDLPGHFICGHLLGLFYRFGKNLFEEQRIKRFITPLVIVKEKDNIINWFYTFDEYLSFEKENKNKKYKYDYKKGLGSWDREELDYIISKDGIDNMLEVFVLDENSAMNLDNWLNSKKADERKAMLEGFEFNIMEM